MLTEFTNQRWSEDFLNITMILLKKKQQVRKCSVYQIISLISHIEKIIPCTLNRWLQNTEWRWLKRISLVSKEEEEVWDTFIILRFISDTAFAVKEICICFTDWQTAFNLINWKHSRKLAPSVGIADDSSTCVYNNMKVGKDMCQGCCIPHTWFNLYRLWRKLQNRMQSLKLSSMK